jgi:hypothetical protein
MKTKIKEDVNVACANEKAQLELIEKKVEIQKKRLEIRKEKLLIGKIILEKEKELLDLKERAVSIQSKELQNIKAKNDIDEIPIERNLEKDKLLNDKIFSVLLSLICNTINDERTILGSEPFYEPLLKEGHKEKALNKLMELINKL